ncbi:uncharacterized protein LOC105181379 [Harpegnathos saltator]|uniref:uncharacterized protein LOC105181379 n=1 Tax=Harpegnathos saltator TaxID=610380 RepID=UPI000DBED3B2|nr:uncharacterized protein LOC105181379 [Harpegnathos saltator]
MENIINNDEGIKKEQLRCFVCDINVQGRYYYLATCRTQSSRSKVIEILGELVGERYMVVISEDDVICRSCASHINTLDRLEMEMRNVRNHVLRFLERKYCLEEGELLGNSDRPKPSHPPQITKCNTTEIIDSCIKRNNVDSEIYLYNRNQEKEQQQLKQSHARLQCDKCKYTTNLNSFMMHHIRDYMKQKIFCNKCGLCASESKEEILPNSKTIVEQLGGNCEKDHSQITSDNFIDLSLFHKMTQLLPVQATQNTQLPLINASNYEYISSILLPEGNLPSSSQQQTLFLHAMEMDNVEMDISNEKITRISEKA